MNTHTYTRAGGLVPDSSNNRTKIGAKGKQGWEEERFKKCRKNGKGRWGRLLWDWLNF